MTSTSLPQILRSYFEKGQLHNTPTNDICIRYLKIGGILKVLLCFVMFLLVFLQKARLARIQIAKATSGAAFVSKKKAAEARMAERAANGQPEIDNNGKEDIFEMQHHHLLRCLEKTTVSENKI